MGITAKADAFPDTLVEYIGYPWMDKSVTAIVGLTNKTSKNTKTVNYKYYDEYDQETETYTKYSYSKVTAASSNSKVVKIKKLSKTSLRYVFKKSGKATVTLKFYQKGKSKAVRTAKITFRCYKYTNPFSKIKLGQKNITTQFNTPKTISWSSTDYPGLTEFKTLKSGKLSITLKKGWKLVSVYYDNSGFNFQELNSLDNITLKKGDNLDIILKKKSTTERLLIQCTG